MSLELSTVTSGYNLSVINDNFTAIADAWDTKLDRESSTGNQMETDIDMNGYTLYNAKVDTTTEEEQIQLDETKILLYMGV